jgi:hypothetical protein
VITDDQVARLVRNAGFAAPPSLRVDLDAVEKRVARDRTVARTSELLAGVGVLLLVATIWLDPQSKLPNPGTGPGTPSAAFSWAPLLVVLALLMLAVVSTAIAGGHAGRTAEGSRLRAPVAAAWGVLGLLALGPTVYVTSIFVAYPDFVVGAGSQVLAVCSVGAVTFVLAWCALAARRRALGRGRGAFLTTVWIVATWGVGAWIAAAMASFLGRASKLAPIEPHSALSLTAATAIALGCAAVLRRRAGSDHPFLRGLALTVAFAAVGSAYSIGSAAVLGTAFWLTHRAPGAAIAVGMLVVALVAARLSLRRGASDGWLSAVLGVATVSLATAAAIDLWSVILHAVGAPGGSATSSAAWTIGLATAAGLCLAALDRRSSWTRTVTTSSSAEAPTSRTD